MTLAAVVTSSKKRQGLEAEEPEVQHIHTHTRGNGDSTRGLNLLELWEGDRDIGFEPDWPPRTDDA